MSYRGTRHLISNTLKQNKDVLCQPLHIHQQIKGLNEKEGTVLIVMVWQLDLQLPMHSVPITTNIVNKRQRNRQSRENGNIGYTRQRKPKQKDNTLCVGYPYTQINRNNINKT